VTKTLAELRQLCAQYGIAVPPQRRPAKEPYVLALRDYSWSKEYADRPLPEQVEPMLLGDWSDLDPGEAAAIEVDQSGWCVQEKHDGVRVLLHVTDHGVRVTGRTVSDVTFRLSEFQANLPHLATGFEHLVGTILDGELVCPKAGIDTGDTVTTHALQAAVAVLAASPERAGAIQESQDCRLRFVAFDVIRFAGEDVTARRLKERLALLDAAYLAAENPHLGLVETHFSDKGLVHEVLLADGKEGSVWKRLDGPYEPGRRARHWLKRKKGIEVEAVVTGFKPGTRGRGNEHLVGAVEFSTVGPDGRTTPVAWVSNWTDEERERMTRKGSGTVELDPSVRGRRALVGGHDVTGKSGRYRHAKIVKWIAE
jgi:bifunctional non-homologous end joining protein LigD